MKKKKKKKRNEKNLSKTTRKLYPAKEFKKKT